MEEKPLHEYHAVFEWRMSNDEIEAYKLAVCYEREYRRIFGRDEERDRSRTKRRNAIPARGDPRKCDLFRQCWKLRRETRGLLQGEEYRQYIVANLTILKIYRSHVEPSAMCGDKAWIRYKVWKRHFDRKLDEASVKTPAPSVNKTDPKIVRAIDRTKKFLFERCEGEPTFEKMKAFIDAGIMKLWVATGKVSEFYLALSPYVAASGAGDRIATECAASLDLLRQKCTDEVKGYFAYEFAHERDA